MINVLDKRAWQAGPLLIALAAPGFAEDPSAPSAAPRSQLTEQAKSSREKDKENDKPVREGWHIEGFSLRNGKDRIELTGYAQADFRKYDWSVRGDDLNEERNLGSEISRTRFGLQGEIRKFTFEVAYDPREEEGSHLKDATVGYQFSKKAVLMLGHFKPPISQEFLTSASKLDFVERGLVSEIGPDRDWGVALSGDLGKTEYAFGAFDGDGDGDGNVVRAETSFAGRLTREMLLKDLSISASYMYSTTKPGARVGTTEPSPEGTRGRSLTGYTFWRRPHVNGKRHRLGGDLEYSRGPLRVRGEFLQVQDQRKGQGSTGQDIPDVRGRGWLAAASYVLTGEAKGSTVEPEKPLHKGGFGALEIAARVEGLKFDDTGDSSGFEGYGNRARNIAPSGVTVFEIGLNYWPSNFMKFQGSALWEKYNDPLIAPEPGNQGRYFTLMGRIQLMVP